MNKRQGFKDNDDIAVILIGLTQSSIVGCGMLVSEGSR